MVIEATVKGNVSGIKMIKDTDIEKLIADKKEMLKNKIITEEPVAEETEEEKAEGIIEEETEIEEPVINKKNTRNKK